MEPNQERVQPPVQTTPPQVEKNPTIKRFRFILLGILVLFFVFIIPFTAFQLGKKSSKPVQNTQTIVSTPTPTLTPKPTTGSLTENSFQIPELGIKMTLPESLKDLTYTYDLKVGAAYFTTKTLEARDSYCSSKYGSIGSIGKILKSEAAKNEDGPESLNYLEEAAKSIPSSAKDFGTYFINYSSPQATCSDDKSVQTMQTSQISALKQAFSTVELTQ